MVIRTHDTVGRCICGCKGVAGAPLDWSLYQNCPARWRRKYAEADRRIAKRSEERKRARELREQGERVLKQHQSQNHREAEKERIKLNLPAQSAAEARRRGLATYAGKPCKEGHDGMRDSRNGECCFCRDHARRLRDAMKRGAYPRTLNNEEKKRIRLMYEQARKMSRETGIEHHVDHIKPLSAGGEHHPDNLQILTKEQNLKKGSRWKPSSTYRQVGNGRKESIAPDSTSQIPSDKAPTPPKTLYRGLADDQPSHL